MEAIFSQVQAAINGNMGMANDQISKFITDRSFVQYLLPVPSAKLQHFTLKAKYHSPKQSFECQVDDNMFYVLIIHP